jgi:hypothetical protein
MKSLTIKDLAVTEQLDGAAMAAVRGGFCDFKMPSCFPKQHEYQSYPPSSVTTTTVDIAQANNQFQSNATGNGSAVFGGSISACNNQQGFNSIG